MSFIPHNTHSSFFFHPPAEAELLQDTLTCGSCQKVFVLSEIVKFIQHKVHSCNKENSNFILLEDGGHDHEEGPAAPLQRVGAAPSISAPICNRKGPLHNHRRGKEAFFRRELFEEDRKKDMPVIKQEVKDPSLRCSPKITVNAYTNTIITGELFWCYPW